MRDITIQDPLYGEVRFDRSLVKLLLTPAVQRLRAIRLSNVDSLSLPGLSGVTRFEHAVGTAIVAGHLGFFSSLPREERIILQAAALIHDTAITPYGHLVEEAFRSVGGSFDHELKWKQLCNEEEATQPGGLQSQIYLGREAGFRIWAESEFGPRWRDVLAAVVDAIQGQGRFGPVIAGELDVDNIDNVARAAFHMGLLCDQGMPARLSANIRGTRGDRLLVGGDTEELIEEWLALRKAVYTKLMLAKADYAGKAMMLAAAIGAYEHGVITEDDWVLTDAQFQSRILSSKCEYAKEPLKRWLLGDLWPLGDIVWMDGELPSLPKMYDFSKRLSDVIGRCMAYRIADKRHRVVHVRTMDGSDVMLGNMGRTWLFGVAAEKTLSKENQTRTLEEAQSEFGSEIVGYVCGDLDGAPRLF